jgi:hypothetical protein
MTRRIPSLGSSRHPGLITLGQHIWLFRRLYIYAHGEGNLGVLRATQASILRLARCQQAILDVRSLTAPWAPEPWALPFVPCRRGGPSSPPPAPSRAVWFNLLQPLRLGDHLPHVGATLATWWPATSAAIPTKSRRSFNSLCLLIMRAIWTERNPRVFADKACLASDLSSLVRSEWHEWVRCRIRGRTLGE